LKPIHVISILAILAALALSSCATPAATADNSAMEAAISSTLAVMQTQMAQANVANATSAAAEGAVVEPTATLEPTAAVEPTSAETPAVVPTETTIVPVSSESYGPSFRVGHVIDINIPDGTFVDAKLKFVKTWKITNVGTATWQADYKLVPVDGNPLNAPEYVTLGQVVSPGQSITISLWLTSPEVPGTYTGKFMLETTDGVQFGIGSNFDEPFWAKIISHK
jgi:type II secretory pathway pseudopilin PulG